MTSRHPDNVSVATSAMTRRKRLTRGRVYSHAIPDRNFLSKPRRAAFKFPVLPVMARALSCLCVTFRVCTNAMKTITLDEPAYARLKAWKQTPKESFSSVVKRVLPEPGTLGAFLNFVETHNTGALPDNEVMEQSLNERSDAKNDPWT